MALADNPLNTLEEVVSVHAVCITKAAMHAILSQRLLGIKRTAQAGALIRVCDGAEAQTTQPEIKFVGLTHVARMFGFV